MSESQSSDFFYAVNCGKILNMKVRLLGCGAVGAPLAVALCPVCDFALLLSSERKAAYREKGVFVNGSRYDFKIDETPSADVDLIILACKNFDLLNALPLIDPYVGPGTSIISLLNGVDSEDILTARYGSKKVLYAFITNLSSNRTEHSVTCFSKSGTIIFGEKNNEVTRRVKIISELFEKAGVSYRVPEDILHEIWWKFMLNTCFNSLSGILGTPYYAMASNEPLLRAARVIAAEVQAVARACGITLTEEDVRRMMSQMTSLTDGGKTSLLQDIEAGRKTENRYFAGTVSRLGAQHDVKTPISDFVYTLVEASSCAKE